jgi:hypothetical protein
MRRWCMGSVRTRVWVREAVVESQVRWLIIFEVRSNLFVWSLRGRRPGPAAEGGQGDAVPIMKAPSEFSREGRWCGVCKRAYILNDMCHYIAHIRAIMEISRLAPLDQRRSHVVQPLKRHLNRPNLFATSFIPQLSTHNHPYLTLYIQYVIGIVSHSLS